MIALAALTAPAFAQTGYTITGYMSNFDYNNRCDDDCDELEVDIDGVHPEDIVHTYHNGNYGSPSVTLSAATEGFYSVRITNTCASIISNSALVFITGHNSPPVHQLECPVITAQPVSTAGCVSDTHPFAITATGSDPMALRWQLRGANGALAADLFDGTYFDPSTGLRFTVSGSSTNALRVGGFALGNSPANLAFAARVSNACGALTSDAANLSLCACLACPADFNQDGGVDGADVERFFSAWQASNCDADVNQDGGVDGGDVESFFVAWDGGGC